MPLTSFASIPTEAVGRNAPPSDSNTASSRNPAYDSDVRRVSTISATIPNAHQSPPPQQQQQHSQPLVSFAQQSMNHNMRMMSPSVGSPSGGGGGGSGYVNRYQEQKNLPRGSVVMAPMSAGDAFGAPFNAFGSPNAPPRFDNLAMMTPPQQSNGDSFGRGGLIPEVANVFSLPSDSLLIYLSSR